LLQALARDVLLLARRASIVSRLVQWMSAV
jgi:hypothetical protein